MVWTVCKCSGENPDVYATTITDFISKGGEDRAPMKLIRVSPNCKPWINQEIHSLLKTSRVGFKPGDPDQYRKSRYDLGKTIRKAKRQYRT
eukprot:g12722.t1